MANGTTDEKRIKARNINAAKRLLRFAVQRMIQCPGHKGRRCGAILDIRSAVLLESEKGSGISCGPCWDRNGIADERLAALGIGKVDGRKPSAQTIFVGDGPRPVSS